MGSQGGTEEELITGAPASLLHLNASWDRPAQLHHKSKCWSYSKRQLTVLKTGGNTFYRTMNRLCSILCTVSSGNFPLNCGLPYIISIQVSSIARKQTFFLALEGQTVAQLCFVSAVLRSSGQNTLSIATLGVTSDITCASWSNRWKFQRRQNRPQDRISPSCQVI